MRTKQIEKKTKQICVKKTACLRHIDYVYTALKQAMGEMLCYTLMFMVGVRQIDALHFRMARLKDRILHCIHVYSESSNVATRFLRRAKPRVTRM